MAALAQSNSAPTLPPLSPSRSPPPGALAAHSRAAQRGASEASKRNSFLSGLINQDLQKLTSWHGTRPPHEQKRFLRSVDSLYKAYDAASGGVEARPKHRITEAEKAAAAAAAQEAAFASAAALQRAAEEDPLKGPPRSPRALGHSASEPSLVPAQPIDVFEQKKKQSFKKNRDPTGEDPNNLMDWLEGQSLTSQTTATTAQSRQTRFSDLTMTSLGASSTCSEPGTMHQTHFRAHKRAYAVNKKCFVSINQHEDGFLQGGVPNSNWPDSERLQTTFKDQFGSRPKGQNISKKMYENVLQNDKHEFVNRFLETAPPEQKEQFSGMVRSLQYLRQKDKKEKSSAATIDWDLAENERLWKPPRQQPVFETDERNLSRIPLGSMQQTTKKAPLPPSGPPPQQQQPPPPSPSVSGLGSLPLTRMSTPQVLSDAGY